ncbi:hypothetical protein [Methylotenera sp.]|uniref:hypothetical protein n=1 Tax=Methylotenera sp. TaxID=2051956 RepID=UPI0027313C6C|nr:hypothetical protein [Methylotenera sp.]MDP2071310.1 hypothetical protein [Methylotenera sp.]MDP3005227.1 hypothetical protein [Methylotenera sp.]
MNQSEIDNTKSSNKWLYIVLLITLGSVAWTAMHSDDANEEINVELEVNQSSAENKQSLARNSGSGRLNQPSAAKNVQASFNQSSLIPWERLKREPEENKPHDVFKVHSWVVVPPVKKALPPPPPPPPEAPPAPFIYMGKLENSPKGTLVFLMESNKLYSVVMGEKINQQWRLDSEDAGTLRLTYMPLDLKQVLSKTAKQVVSTAAEINQ